MMAGAETIVFFDGVCAMCNGFVKFAARRDKHDVLRFAPLQGDTAADMRKVHTRFPAGLISLVVVDDGEVLLRTDGVIRALHKMGGFWSFVGSCMKIWPRFIRDTAYDFVARVRYRVFGEYETCPVPPLEMRRRFLA